MNSKLKKYRSDVEDLLGLDFIHSINKEGGWSDNMLISSDIRMFVVNCFFLEISPKDCVDKIKKGVSNV